MKFCTECAAPLEHSVPEGDNRLRAVCRQCGFVHYENPKMVIGTVPFWDADGRPQILLCRRAIEPRYGCWTLPAGFMENDETCEEAALRETVEEAGATVALDAPFSMLSVLQANQVHLFYRAWLVHPAFAAGPESLEVALFDIGDIPWDDLAFQTTRLTLRFFLDDLEAIRSGGCFRFHTHDLRR